MTLPSVSLTYLIRCSGIQSSSVLSSSQSLSATSLIPSNLSKYPRVKDEGLKLASHRNRATISVHISHGAAVTWLLDICYLSPVSAWSNMMQQNRSQRDLEFVLGPSSPCADIGPLLPGVFVARQPPVWCPPRSLSNDLERFVSVLRATAVLARICLMPEKPPYPRILQYSRKTLFSDFRRAAKRSCAFTVTYSYKYQALMQKVDLPQPQVSRLCKPFFHDCDSLWTSIS